MFAYVSRVGNQSMIRWLGSFAGLTIPSLDVCFPRGMSLVASASTTVPSPLAMLPTRTADNLYALTYDPLRHHVQLKDDRQLEYPSLPPPVSSQEADPRRLQSATAEGQVACYWQSRGAVAVNLHLSPTVVVKRRRRRWMQGLRPRPPEAYPRRYVEEANRA
jgi:hypothetical protein